MRKVGDDALGGAAVPELRHAAALAAAGEDLVDRAQDRRRIAADQRVGALVDGDRPLGVLAQR